METQGLITDCCTCCVLLICSLFVFLPFRTTLYLVLEPKTQDRTNKHCLYTIFFIEDVKISLTYFPFRGQQIFFRSIPITIIIRNQDKYPIFGADTYICSKNENFVSKFIVTHNFL